MYSYEPKNYNQNKPYLLDMTRSDKNTMKPLDFGPMPNVVDIKKATMNNKNYRTALWTGSHIQLTVMNLAPNEDIGLEMHPDVDQFLYVIDGVGRVRMGDRKDHFSIQQLVFEDDAILIPAGTWHDVTNVGKGDLKLFSIYGPPNHPWGTIHQTKEIAESMEHY